MSLSCSMSTFIHTSMNDWMTECYFSYGMWRRQKLQVLSRNVPDVCRIIILSIIFTLPFTVSWTKPHRIFAKDHCFFNTSAFGFPEYDIQIWYAICPKRLHILCWRELSRRRLQPAVSPAAGHLTTPTVAGLPGLCENFRPTTSKSSPI